MLSIFRRIMVELSPIYLLLLMAVIVVISMVKVAGYAREKEPLCHCQNSMMNRLRG
jgi:hypothetical protein